MILSPDSPNSSQQPVSSHSYKLHTAVPSGGVAPWDGRNALTYPRRALKSNSDCAYGELLKTLVSVRVTWPLDTSHTNRLGQELPESVRAAPVTRRGGRLLQQLNKGQLLLVGLNVNFSPGALSVMVRYAGLLTPGLNFG